MNIMRTTIAQYERALVWKSKRFAGVMEPGVHWIVDPLNRLQLQSYDLGVPEFEHTRIELLLKEERATIEKYFHIVDLGATEAGLVYKSGKLAGVLAPGTRQLYWRDAVDVRVERVDISQTLEVEPRVAKLLARAQQPLAAQAQDAVTVVEVPHTSVGLLIVDGELAKALEPGLHVFWKFQRTLEVELVDRRVQPMEVSDQEVLTRDKVSFRVNLTALWQVVDAVKARSGLQDFEEFVYGELRSALREVIGARTVEEMLGAKNELDLKIGNAARNAMEQHGIVLRSAGIKDVVRIPVLAA